MLRWLHAIAPPLVAIALVCMMPRVVHAAPVSFSTTGIFSVTNSPDTGAGTATLTSGNTGTTLKFTGEPAGFADATLLPLTASLGTFTLTLPNTSTSGSFAAGDTFQLTITQTDPAGGPSSSSAAVTGTVSIVPVGLDSASVQVITFGPNPVVIGSYRYFVKPMTLTWSSDVPGKAEGTLLATVATVPLPATANMGLGLMLCLGGIGAWRRMKGTQAVA